MKKNTNHSPLTLETKAKKGFRRYATAVLTVALLGCLSLTAFAAGDDRS